MSRRPVFVSVAYAFENHALKGLPTVSILCRYFTWNLSLPTSFDVLKIKYLYRIYLARFSKARKFINFLWISGVYDSKFKNKLLKRIARYVARSVACRTESIDETNLVFLHFRAPSFGFVWCSTTQGDLLRDIIS